ncbi:MAG: type II toxin-antitoxin system RelB family antitoxin [Anaerovoracaceae bacterium]
MAISLRLTVEEESLIKEYAKIHKLSVSELVRQSVLERIEDEHDLHLYEEALKEHLANPKIYSLDEVEKELGLK